MSCIEAPGSPTTHGYRRVTVGGKRKLAHRAAWEERHGPIPDGKVIRHDCDNPPCWNADHLQIGTQADNLADMKARGRSNAGTAHWNDRLTPEQVHEIRTAPGTQREIARRFGISQPHVSDIRTGKKWSIA